MYYKSLSNQELKRHANFGGLDFYGKRCKEELDRRRQEQNEILSL